MTVGELIERLALFPPEFAVFCRLDEASLAVVAPVEVRMDLTNPSTLTALENDHSLPAGFIDSVVLFPFEIRDED